jgi:hypothetical protein
MLLTELQQGQKSQMLPVLESAPRNCIHFPGYAIIFGIVKFIRDVSITLMARQTAIRVVLEVLVLLASSLAGQFASQFAAAPQMHFVV